jgi:sulfoquinovosyltransferase
MSLTHFFLSLWYFIMLRCSSSIGTASASADAAPRLRVCIVVEPSPFTYVCGYSNRFKALLEHLQEENDIVEVITTEVVMATTDRPQFWRQFPIHYTAGIRLPHYPLISIGMDWKMKIGRVLHAFKPDILHVRSPGLMVMAAVPWSRLFQIPLLISYHTHLPVYVRSYIRPKIARQCTEWLGTHD